METNRRQAFAHRRLRFFRRWTPALFALLRLPAPQLAQHVVARHQAVITEALAEGDIARVVESLNGGFDAPPRIVRRARRAAVEEDVVLDLQPAHFIFETIKLFVNRVDLPGIHSHPQAGT